MRDHRGTDQRVKAALALLDSVLFALLVAALLWRAVPDQNRELVSAAAGFLAGWVSAGRGFYFGTTSTSETKTQAIADLAKTSGPETNLQVKPPAEISIKPTAATFRDRYAPTETGNDRPV